MTTLEDCDEEEGRTAVGGSGRGVGQVGEGARPVADRAGRTAQTVHQIRPGNRAERRDVPRGLRPGEAPTRTSGTTKTKPRRNGNRRIFATGLGRRRC